MMSPFGTKRTSALLRPITSCVADTAAHPPTAPMDQNADRHVIESVHGVAPASPASPSLTLSTMRARLIQVKIVVSLVRSSFNYSIELNSRAGALCTRCAGGGALYERI